MAAPSFVFPLPAGSFSLSQHFGVKNSRDAGGHPGVDYAAPAGTPIYAAAAGTVITAGYESGFGNHAVRIRMPDGSVATYGHGSALFVKVGDIVTAGQRIASVGSEGESTGNHLHFQINNAAGALVNPETWLASHGAGSQNATAADISASPAGLVSDVGGAITGALSSMAEHLFMIGVKLALVGAGGGLIVYAGIAASRKGTR